MEKESLKRAFEYLRSKGKVHTQKELAEITGYSQPTISSAFKGDSRYLTESFLSNFNKAFGNMFNEDWLLTGNGEMLADTNDVQHDVPSHTDYSEILANELRQRIKDMNRLIEEKDERIKLLSLLLEARDREIAMLKGNRSEKVG